MKKSWMFACVVLLVSLWGCATTSKEPVVDPNFLGDYDPIQLENVMAWYNFFGKEKPKELEMYFVPRTNNVEIYYREGQNKVCVILSQEQREQLKEVAALFTEGVEAGTLEDRKPTTKNAYYKSTCSVGWGVLGIGRVTEKSRLEYNHKYLKDGKVYLSVRAYPAADKNDSSVYSPDIELFFSPSQLETLFAQIDQSVLQARVDELNAQAYEY